MPHTRFPSLVELSKTELKLKDPESDLRHHKVVDKDGEMVGTVSDMLIDRESLQPRFLLVESGGFLGMGEKTIMIPVETITLVESKIVYVSFNREHAAQGPRFQPELTGVESFWVDAYGHYDDLPFWAPGNHEPDTRDDS